MKTKSKITLSLLTSALLSFGLTPTASAGQTTPLNGAQPRPFYMVAHNPNTLEDVEDALKKGFNALEPDITEMTCGGEEVLVDFDSDAGTPTCGAELRFFDWCKGVNALAQQYPQLSLVAFDIKKWAGDPDWSNDGQVQQNAVDIINAARFLLNSNGVNLNIIYSVPSISHSAIMHDMLQIPLGPREGVQIDDEDSVDAVLNWFFHTNNYAGNIGYGDGTSTIYYPLPRAMDRAAYLRASVGYPKIVSYVYVLDTQASMHSFINGGVDGIIPMDADQGDLTNVVTMHPEIRLANRNDNPFQPLNEAYAIEVHTGDDGTSSDILFTLNGCRGSANITVNGGNITPGYPTGRFASGNPDWITVPSKDLGKLQSITIKNLGGALNTQWKLADVHVSSARYLGPNWGVNGQPTHEYSATFGGSLDTGDSVTLNLVPVPGFGQPPSIECPAPVTVSNDQDQCGAVVTFSPQVSSPCDDAIAVCSPASGTLFPAGTTVVHCHAESPTCGSSPECTFTVTVEDKQPPAITCPAPLVVKATSPAGAVVPFAPTVSDNCAVAAVTCSPASGSTFAIGDTSVTCIAVDLSTNQSSCTFNVHVEGAAEQTADLLTIVSGLNTIPPVKKALLSQLNAVLASLNNNDLQAACGALQSFINLVDAHKGHAISVSDANMLIAAAQQIQAVIGCK
jgi:hypothetical protein